MFKVERFKPWKKSTSGSGNHIWWWIRMFVTTWIPVMTTLLSTWSYGLTSGDYEKSSIGRVTKSFKPVVWWTKSSWVRVGSWKRKVTPATLPTLLLSPPDSHPFYHLFTPPLYCHRFSATILFTSTFSLRPLSSSPWQSFPLSSPFLPTLSPFFFSLPPLSLFFGWGVDNLPESRWNHSVFVYSHTPCYEIGKDLFWVPYFF